MSESDPEQDYQSTWWDECTDCGDRTSNGTKCRGCSAIEFRQQCAEESK